MPVRFTSPRLAGVIGPQLEKHRWQFDLAYRHLGANQWFVGTQVQESAAPFGKPLYVNIQSFDVSATYAFTNRATVALTLPFSYGTHSRYYADGVRHAVSAGGLGDVSVVPSFWLLAPAKHPKGNVSVGAGLKAPTGNNDSLDNFYLAKGGVIQSPVDQSIQLGDGGWGIILQGQAYRSLGARFSAYGNAWYLVSPKEKTNVASPLPGVTLSVPDVYSYRLGATSTISPKKAVSASLGVRVDGIPLRDLIGDDGGFRRPGYSLFLEPGVSFAKGRGLYTVSVPIRVHQDFKPSLADLQQGKPGGGDLARYLVLAGYSIRF